MDAWEALPEGKSLYCVGFMFSLGMKAVVLIRKKRPDWQRGLLNGVGGKLQGGEAPLEGMRREFREETGVEWDDWSPLARLDFPEATVWFFWAASDSAFMACKTQTDEEVEFHFTDELWQRGSFGSDLGIVPNALWLVPMAMTLASGKEHANCFAVQEVYLGKTMAIKVPASWWQMLKRDCLPAWLTRRFPVRTRDVTETFSFEQQVRVCPHSDVAFSDPRHMGFLTFEQGEAKEGALYAIEGESDDYQRYVMRGYCGTIERRRTGLIEARVPSDREARFRDWLSFQGNLTFRRMDNDTGRDEGYAAGVVQGDSGTPRQP
jgi:8-oxo-dGTP diphosphatase